jgi:hypothetical protein
MPTIKRIPGPYRLFFYSADCSERTHVHAQRDRSVCKFWLAPLSLAENYGISAHDMRVIRRIIFEYRPLILEAWYEHCGETE